jgi:4-amino-4-deoxy-L-arabinose transferase-like glycosyltransferase
MSSSEFDVSLAKAFGVGRWTLDVGRFSVDRFRPLLIVIVIWAAIYLPGLGSLEIKGEEGRRILPAVTMLETGNYIVPQVGSEPYFRKPPLVNWLVAASFRIFGQRNEWTARLPSALCVLAVAIAFVTIARTALGGTGSIMAALIWMTNFGMIEKGRLIEIEALYVSLTGLAFICWLSWWKEQRSPWLVWTVPWIFLGVAMLAKGPLHLLFFYAIVVAVLHRAGELRQVFHAAHFCGIMIMSAIFAAWAIPFLQMMPHSPVAETWSRQFTGRLAGEDFHLGGWLMNIPRGLGYFLPWTLLLPFAGGAQFDSERERNLARGLGFGTAISFLIVALIPGALARYNMPLLVPASWLMAMTLTAETVAWPQAIGKRLATPQQRFRKVVGFALIVAVAIWIYALAIIPQLQHRQKIKNIATQIEAVVPATESLYAVDPDYQPYLFYLGRRLVYVGRLDDVPLDAHYLLVQPAQQLEAEASERWAPLRAQPILQIKDYRGRRVAILKIGGT